MGPFQGYYKSSFKGSIGWGSGFRGWGFGVLGFGGLVFGDCGFRGLGI